METENVRVDVLTTIQVNRVRHFPGETLEMDVKRAKELESQGAVLIDAEDPVENEVDEAEILNAITAVIPKLAEGDFKATGDKAPKVKAVERELSGQYRADDITADLVAIAWSQLSATKTAENNTDSDGKADGGGTADGETADGDGA